jgi:hypothetical protein
VPADALPEGVAIDRQALDEIRSVWEELKSALEEGNWTRYGELLNELEEKINNL